MQQMRVMAQHKTRYKVDTSHFKAFMPLMINPYLRQAKEFVKGNRDTPCLLCPILGNSHLQFRQHVSLPRSQIPAHNDHRGCQEYRKTNHLEL